MLHTGLKSFVGIAVAAPTGAYIYAQNDEGLNRMVTAFQTMGSIQARFEFHSTMRGMDRRSLHKQYAPEVLDMVLNLGGYYIKIAQTLVGAYVLPEVYDDVFEVLLDKVTLRSFSNVKSIIEHELGAPLSENFLEFNDNPIGAASIGWVHKATLKNGKACVVKVQ